MVETGVEDSKGSRIGHLSILKPCSSVANIGHAFRPLVCQLRNPRVVAPPH